MSRYVVSAAALGLSIAFSPPVATAGQTIHFSCSKNKTDGRVLVNGVDYANKLASLGYKKHPDKWGTVDYNVGYDVLAFEKVRDTDVVWAQGVCRLKLIPR